MSGRCFRRPNLLLTVPMVFGAAAFMSVASSPAPATPDPLNPVFKAVPGPFRPQFPENDQSQGPPPNSTEIGRAHV